MMNIKIASVIKNKVPNVRLGVLSFEVCIKESSEELKSLINKDICELVNTVSIENIRDREVIRATKKAYRILGKDPSRYRPSAESLLRRVVAGKGLYEINNVVDLLNLISIQTGYSICSFDVEQVKGDITFDVGLKSDLYNGIGRGKLNIENLPVFKDQIGAFGTPTSDSVRTMVTENTNRFSMVLISFNGEENLDNILDETIVKYEKYIAAKLIDKQII